MNAILGSDSVDKEECPDNTLASIYAYGVYTQVSRSSAISGLFAISSLPALNSSETDHSRSVRKMRACIPSHRQCAMPKILPAEATPLATS